MKLLSASRCTRATGAMLTAFFLCCCVIARAQSPVFDEVHSVAASTQGVPVEYSFNITQTGTYQVTLTDLGAQLNPAAPLAAVKLAVTQGDAIVGTPLTQAGTTQFTATATGTYVVHVVGKPGSQFGSGPFGVTVTNTTTNAQAAAFSNSLTLPQTTASNVAVLSDTFTVSAAGSYTVTLTDQQFPQALQIVELALTTPGATSLLASLSIANGTGSPASQAVTLQPNTTYDIYSFGGATTGVNAGLYSAVVRDSNNNVVYSRTLPIGMVTALGSASLGAGTYNLKYSDLAYPAALSGTGTNGALVTLVDQVAGRLTTAGSKSFTASAGTYSVFGLGTAAAAAGGAAGAAPSGGGSYAAEIQPGSGADVFSAAQAVVVPGGALQAYTFSGNVATAGSYQLQLADYQLPQALTSISMAPVQGGAILGTPISAAGSTSVTAATGNLELLVFAQAPAAGSVFGIFATASGGGTPLVEATQGVGALFTSQKVSITSAGQYVANVTDLGFPANFSTLYVLVTQGTTLSGSAIGSGSFPVTVSAAGDYFVTFTAQPQGTDQAGTYAINIAPPPAKPTVSLTTSASQVASGGNATLTWSSQNATSCTASNGWSGVEPTSGSASTGILTAAATFTLTCTGPGGSASQSVTVSITQSGSSGGGGGGGVLDPSLLAVLATALGLARRRRPAAAFPRNE
jgi:hypothetical protein